MTSIGIEAERTASVSLGDIDGDGDLDVVFANGRHWPSQNRVFINNGEGRLTSSRPLGEELETTYAAPLADLDGDGDLDVAVGNDRAPNRILWNDGSGRFIAGPTFGGIESTRGAFIADLDGNGLDDVVLTNRGDLNSIFWNDEAHRGTLERRGSFGTSTDSTISIGIGDLDGDGDLDLALANRDGQPNQVQWNDGQGNFSDGPQFGTGSDETRGVAIADLDGDGHLDIATANIGEPNAVYYSDGRGDFRSSMAFGAKDGRSYAVAIADLNNDDQPDLLVANARQRNQIYLLDPNDPTHRRVMQAVPFGHPESDTYGLGVGDLDRDGQLDIVTANSDAMNHLYTRDR